MELEMTPTAPPAARPARPAALGDARPPTCRAAIREIKAALRARIAASGRTVEEVFAVVEAARRAPQVDRDRGGPAAGEPVWPVIDYADIAAGAVSADQLDQLRRRGCLVVRGHFPREQALGWDRDIVDYVEGNHFFENYRGPGDDFFGSVGSKPEIYPIYWSPAQMQARQSERMATVQAFLNRLWKHESDGVQWFDPRSRLALPRPHPPPPARAPTPAASAPTSTPAPSTCG